MFHYLKKSLIVLAVLILSLVGCSSTEKTNNSSDKLIVTTTIGMIADVVKNVGGEHVEVTGLMKSGVDPHLYKASQGDIKKLEDADLIFYNGLHLEGKMVDIFEKMSKQKPTIAVTKDIPESELHAPDDGANNHDPHVWFNVQLWNTATKTIADELSKIDPDNAADYSKNAEEYIQQLEELDQYAKEQIATIPDQTRVLVTAHDAFGYFGEAYDIKVMGLQGISTASEYGSKDVSSLRDYLVENKIKAVFVESSVPKKAIEAVIEGAKEQGHEVVIGGELFSDAMGEAGTEEGTYLGMVRHNVDTIVNALK
ncbi:metal ABC transporter solute-binding protein, Zn/Mn family [Bacillus sp. OK048]|uniref:metal ABC transporter solute-binding protein, Zn/Mn family n=1 Tax=Bacillus sp. OK048 TaxID=1882761 RepID=UPI000891121E|nr:zinc ABC transporter substrate-binding protein [Bacillus sp. OK048]SDN51122.1 manganese/zinc/iron transport system substrate-binding protein [Bacillus sp. OK048]